MSGARWFDMEEGDLIMKAKENVIDSHMTKCRIGVNVEIVINQWVIFQQSMFL